VVKEPPSTVFVFRRDGGDWRTALVWHPRLEFLRMGLAAGQRADTVSAALRLARASSHDDDAFASSSLESVAPYGRSGMGGRPVG
jgi:hypothetical protein